MKVDLRLAMVERSLVVDDAVIEQYLEHMPGHDLVGEGWGLIRDYQPQLHRWVAAAGEEENPEYPLPEFEAAVQVYWFTHTHFASLGRPMLPVTQETLQKAEDADFEDGRVMAPADMIADMVKFWKGSGFELYIEAVAAQGDAVPLIHAGVMYRALEGQELQHQAENRRLEDVFGSADI